MMCGRMDLSEEITVRTERLLSGKLSREEMLHEYSNWSKSYDKDVVSFYRGAKLLAECTAQFLGDRKGARILDCGAGTGLVGYELSKHGFTNIDGIDGCKEMLQEAKKKGVYTNLICDFLGANKLDIDDNTYDAAICVGCFAPDHMTDDCFEELTRITKPGGVVILQVREGSLEDQIAFKSTLEQKMQHLHDTGSWRWIKREAVSGHLKDEPAVVYYFEVL